MRLIYPFASILSGLLMINIALTAQCDAVSVGAFPFDPQSGPHNYFGVSASLSQAYNQDVTVSGYIYDQGDPNHNHPFSLTIIAGDLSAQTSSTFYETCPTCDATVEVSSVSPCPPPPPQYTIVSEPSVNVKNQMIAAFQSLQINFAQLSTALNLGHTLNINDIDFDHLSRSYITNDDVDGVAIVAPFLSNSSNNPTNYAFFLATDGSSYSPMLVKATTDQLFQFFDLEEDVVTSIYNYSNNNLSTQISTGGYNPAGRVVPCGQAVANCITDAYANHGWVSVWAFVQTLWIPATGAAIVAACIARNCFKK